MANYINNEHFLEAMIEYKEKISDAEKENKEIPPVPDYVGECFLLIAQRLSFRPNFINYAFKDDMISDGIENCLQYVNNFNPEKSTNPFAYFTQIIYWAFVRRIQKEKKNLYIKYKEMDRLSYLDDHIDSSPDDNKEYLNLIGSADSRNAISKFIEDFEEKRFKKRKKKEDEVSEDKEDNIISNIGTVYV